MLPTPACMFVSSLLRRKPLFIAGLPYLDSPILTLFTSKQASRFVYGQSVPLKVAENNWKRRQAIGKLCLRYRRALVGMSKKLRFVVSPSVSRWVCFVVVIQEPIRRGSPPGDKGKQKVGASWDCKATHLPLVTGGMTATWKIGRRKRWLFTYWAG
jgi:hypothetical protein